MDGGGVMGGGMGSDGMMGCGGMGGPLGAMGGMGSALPVAPACGAICGGSVMQPTSSAPPPKANAGAVAFGELDPLSMLSSPAAPSGMQQRVGAAPKKPAARKVSGGGWDNW